MRVIVERDGEEGTRDCYGALGLIHSLWKPMPGRFKDYVAMPKLNRYRALHTTVIGPEGKPLEIQIRTREMHREAEFGIAAHWIYKRGRKGKARRGVDEVGRSRSWTWQADEADPREFIKTFRTDLFDDEVYVFTPKGEVKTLPAGSTPSTSRTPCTPTSATARRARRSTAASSRSTTACRAATSSRS